MQPSVFYLFQLLALSIAPAVGATLGSGYDTPPLLSRRSPQVWEYISPAGAPPAGCKPDSAFTFGFETIRPSEEPNGPSAPSTTCDSAGTLAMNLRSGVLTDKMGRIGSIVANRQFQFDGPPAQAGAIYTSGWSICPNGLLALGPKTTFYRCKSGTCELPEVPLSPVLPVCCADWWPCVQSTMSTTRALAASVSPSS